MSDNHYNISKKTRDKMHNMTFIRIYEAGPNGGPWDGLGNGNPSLQVQLFETQNDMLIHLKNNNNKILDNEAYFELSPCKLLTI